MTKKNDDELPKITVNPGTASTATGGPLWGRVGTGAASAAYTSYTTGSTPSARIEQDIRDLKDAHTKAEVRASATEYRAINVEAKAFAMEEKIRKLEELVADLYKTVTDGKPSPEQVALIEAFQEQIEMLSAENDLLIRKNNVFAKMYKDIGSVSPENHKAVYRAYYDAQDGLRKLDENEDY